jgi:hypothetical protein
MDNELEVISAEAVAANSILPFSFVYLRGTEEDCGLRRVRLDNSLPESEGNTSHPAQVGDPFTVGFTTKLMYALIIINCNLVVTRWQQSLH